MADGVEIVAHRGASYSAPENTLAAVNLGWRRGADAVEIDVYLSRDRRIVVIHDKDTKRTAGVDRQVNRMTLAELKTHDVGRYRGPQFAGERIPTLEEVLATIPNGKRLLIEIKCGPEIVPELKRVLAAAGKQPAQTAVISFDFAVVTAAKKALPQLCVMWLLGTTPKRDEQTGKVLVTLAERIEQCRRGGLDGLSFSRESALSPEFVRQVHDAGLQLHVWTVNSAEEARRLRDCGVDSITTDRPGWLREQLE